MSKRATLLFLASAVLLSASALYATRSLRAEVPLERSYQNALAKAVAEAQADLEANSELFEDHSSWDNPWIVQSTHYEVRTIHSRGLGLEISKGLETMRGYFIELLGDVGPSGRGRVFIFPDRVSYNSFGDQFGEHHSSVLGGFYAEGHADRPVATYLDESKTRTQMWITHCAVHQFLAGVPGVRASTWIDEGLASYFALFWDFSYGARELEALKEAGRLVPIAQLMREDLAAYTADPHARFIQLGMMFTYLLRYREETRHLEGELAPIASFSEYLAAIAAGESVQDLSFTAFLAEEGPSLERDFLEFEFE